MKRHESGRLAAILVGCLLLSATGQADRIVMKDGRIIEGKIVSEDGVQVKIDVGGIRTTLFREKIGSIEKVADSAVGPGEGKATVALKAIDAGDIAGAWGALMEMDSLEPKAYVRHAVLIRRIVASMRSAVDSAVGKQDGPTALAMIEFLNKPDAKAFFEKTQSESDRSELADYLKKASVAAHHAYGLKLQAADPGDPRVAAELTAALEAMAPGDAKAVSANYYLSQHYYELGRRESDPKRRQDFFDKCLTHLFAAQDRIKDDPELTDKVVEAVRIIKQRNIVPSTAITPTPSPTPNPILFATPTPIPSPSPTPLPWGQQFSRDVMRDGVVSTLKTRLSGNSVLPLLMQYRWQIGGFVGIYWLLPGLVLGMLVRRRDIYAVAWQPRVWWMGTFTLPAYVIDRVRSRAAAPKRGGLQCPHCQAPLDVLEMYEDMNFNLCHQCKKQIKPVTSLVDYIGTLANSMASEAERANIGAISMTSVAQKDAMQRLVRAIVTLAVRRRASDIHIEPEEQGLVIRHRIDGVITPEATVPRSLGPALISAIKVQASLDISEKRKPQDGAIQIWVDKVDIDIRVATSPSANGEKASLRLLDIRSIQVDPKKLGMPTPARETFERAIRQPDGLILVTGPTGSGKTTTLYVALQMIKTGDKNLISIEDPIEFRIPGINQIQVNPGAGLTFAGGLRSILRQDPDVIMVGEIRDRETAEIAIEAATTGHLVFSTLHTIDSSSSIARLMDLGVSPRQFADSLLLVIAQRLARLVCPDCKGAYKPKDIELEELGIRDEDVEKMEFVRGGGCELCNDTGYFGRTGVFEMLSPDAQLKSAIERGSMSTNEIRELAIGRGMRTLRVEGVGLLRRGVTTVDEILRVTR